MFSIQYSAIFYHYRTFGYEKILQHQTIVSDEKNIKSISVHLRILQFFVFHDVGPTVI